LEGNLDNMKRAIFP